MATEIKAHFPNVRVVLAHSRSELLSSEPLPDEFKDLALQMVIGMGIEVKLGSRVAQTLGAKDTPGSQHQIVFNNGREISCDVVVDTTLKPTMTSSAPFEKVSFTHRGIAVLPT